MAVDRLLRKHIAPILSCLDDIKEKLVIQTHLIIQKVAVYSWFSNYVRVYNFDLVTAGCMCKGAGGSGWSWQV